MRARAIEAATQRLRPILMTSFAFILGVVPLLIGEGAGAEMRKALGTVGLQRDARRDGSSASSSRRCSTR